MKKEFSQRPEIMKENWCTWQEFITAIPSLVFLVTGWKSNGKENACLQSWAAFHGSNPPGFGGEDGFYCVLSFVNKAGHMYQSLKETGVCVLNFPSYDIYEKCIKTIGNNDFETDEITVAGLTVEKATMVNAPRIKECFLNLECEYLWEHDLYENGGFATVALKVVNICMESDIYDENKLGRYGEKGYMFHIDQPTNPDTNEKPDIMISTNHLMKSIPWNTK